MKNTTCLVCKNDFYGRNNQIFCSIECKNKHNNIKTRLIYSVGKHGDDKISDIQDQMYASDERIRKAYAVLVKESDINKAERELLRKDYLDLLKELEKFKADLEKIKRKYLDSLGSAKELDGQLNIIKGLGALFGPMISKAIDNLGKLEDGKKSE
jgi:hypothetical protein